MDPVFQTAWRSLLSLASVAAVTLVARAVVPANPTTVGFAYLLVVLLIASAWGSKSVS